MLEVGKEAEIYNVSFDLTPRQVLGVVGEAPSLPAIKRFQDLVGSVEQVELPVEHYFAPGQYVRRCHIPKETFVVGKMHRHEHVVMLIKGETTILTDKGMERIKAPHVWISQPGAKRPLFTHTDCEFVTVHSTSERDLDALEAELIVPESEIDYSVPAKELPDFSNELQGVYA